jgi:protein phosphatase
MPLLRAAALTDIGRVRRQNEDRFLHDDAMNLFGVADGVGGLPGGAEAAQHAIDIVDAAIRSTAAGQQPDLTAIVLKANVSVAELGQRLSPAMGIGTTLTFGQIADGQLRIAHIGDSRCYGWRRGEFRRLTEDHSVENEARMRRARGEVVYYHEANRNALTRCIGQPTPPEVDVIPRELAAGDRYLFCTDGVTRMIPDSELATMIAQPGEPAAVLKEIIALAVRRGGPDNATGVMVFVDSL